MTERERETAIEKRETEKDSERETVTERETDRQTDRTYRKCLKPQTLLLH